MDCGAEAYAGDFGGVNNDWHSSRSSQAVLSLEEHSSEAMERLQHEVSPRLSSNVPTCSATSRSPLLSHCPSGRRWNGKRTRSVEMPSDGSKGRLDGKRRNAIKKTQTSRSEYNGQNSEVPSLRRRHL